MPAIDYFNLGHPLRRIASGFALRAREGQWRLFEEHFGALLAPLYPLDRTKNGQKARRLVAEVASPVSAPTTTIATNPEVAPLLRQLITAYDRAGLPPAYVPKD